MNTCYISDICGWKIWRQECATYGYLTHLSVSLCAIKAIISLFHIKYIRIRTLMCAWLLLLRLFATLVNSVPLVRKKDVIFSLDGMFACITHIKINIPHATLLWRSVYNVINLKARAETYFNLVTTIFLLVRI